ncbi:putative pectate lyase 1 [Bienertia sinuspersici]
MTSKNDTQHNPDVTNPLYLHPSDGPHTCTIAQKLSRSANYRSGKRDMEIVLVSKRKLGFVTRLVQRDPSKPEKQDLWDTCNNMVIAWLTPSMTPSIKESVVVMRSSKEIWEQLERKFSMNDGTRKYKLNRDAYDLKQKGKPVNEYYIAMKAIWDELDALEDYPPVTVMNTKIRALVDTMNRRKEEARLFQFLYGLDEIYAADRSQLLHYSPLPSVETAVSRIQQEETQREVLKEPKEEEIETTTMFTTKYDEVYLVCGNKGHGRDRCWKVIGNPKWHPNYKRMQKKGEGSHGQRSENRKNSGGRWNKVRQLPNTAKWARNVEKEENVNLTTQQLVQLLKLIPNDGKNTSEGEDEVDANFAGMINCCKALYVSYSRILDTGATDHMTGNLNLIKHPVKMRESDKINLPTGNTSLITHAGDVELENGLILSLISNIT